MTYYKAVYRESDIYQLALQQSCKQLKRFFANNSLLLSQYGITLREQITDMNNKGLSISWDTIRNLKSGTNKTAALVYINLFAVYWGIDGGYLLYRDISKVKLIKYVNLPLCSYPLKGSVS